MIEFYKIRAQTESMEQNGLIKPVFEVSINTIEGLLPISSSNKFSFFTKNIDV